MKVCILFHWNYHRGSFNEGPQLMFMGRIIWKSQNVMTVFSQYHYSRVIRLTQLWCRKLLEGHEFESLLHHPMTGKLSLSSQQ